MKARHKRIGLVVAGLVVVGVATGFVLNALDNNLSYFFSPTEVLAGAAPKDRVFRIGGLVEKGSLQRSDKDLSVHFTVTDGPQKLVVRYSGILPDLFQEGQGVIVQGRMNSDGVFVADEVLAKHDENYMPPEVADALKKGHEQGAANMANQGAAQ
jgi:cytochrome c-type biogenesis protein CcmE